MIASRSRRVARPGLVATRASRTRPRRRTIIGATTRRTGTRRRAGVIVLRDVDLVPARVVPGGGRSGIRRLILRNRRITRRRRRRVITDARRTRSTRSTTARAIRRRFRAHRLTGLGGSAKTLVGVIARSSRMIARHLPRLIAGKTRIRIRATTITVTREIASRRTRTATRETKIKRTRIMKNTHATIGTTDITIGNIRVPILRRIARRILRAIGRHAPLKITDASKHLTIGLSRPVLVILVQGVQTRRTTTASHSQRMPTIERTVVRGVLTTVIRLIPSDPLRADRERRGLVSLNNRSRRRRQSKWHHDEDKQRAENQSENASHAAPKKPTRMIQPSITQVTMDPTDHQYHA